VTIKLNYRNHKWKVAHFDFPLTMVIHYVEPYFWFWTKAKIKELKTDYKYWKANRGPKFAFGTKVNIFRSLSISMVNDPAFVWDNGRKKGLTSHRDAKEYAKRRNLTFGGDDLEQEAQRNKANKEKESEERLHTKIMTDLERKGLLNG